MSLPDSGDADASRGAKGEDFDYLFKFIVIGDTGTGKSCLLHQFIENRFKKSSSHTIGVEFGSKTVVVGGKNIKLQIWDTAGQERFRTITHSYYRGAHGVMLVFDVTSRESFENIQVWLQDVYKFASQDIPMILVGNKADMVASRQVSDEEAQAFANTLGIKYITTSAKSNASVDEAFDQLVDDCIKRRKKTMEARKNTVPVPGPHAPLKPKEPTCQC